MKIKEYGQAKRILVQNLKKQGLRISKKLCYEGVRLNFFYYKGNEINPDYSKVNIIIKDKKGRVKKRMYRFDIKEGKYMKLKAKIMTLAHKEKNIITQQLPLSNFVIDAS